MFESVAYLVDTDILFIKRKVYNTCLIAVSSNNENKFFFLSFFLKKRVRNEEVRRRARIKRVLASRADQRVLRWFGHVERMDEYRMARRVLMA